MSRGWRRHVGRLYRLVDCAHLAAVAGTERVDEVGAVVRIGGRAVSCATDHNIGGARIDGAGAERLQVDEDAIARRPLSRMDRSHPARPEMPVGEMAHVEHLAPPVLALADRAGPSGVDRDHLGALPL